MDTTHLVGTILHLSVSSCHSDAKTTEMCIVTEVSELGVMAEAVSTGAIVMVDEPWTIENNLAIVREEDYVEYRKRFPATWFKPIEGSSLRILRPPTFSDRTEVWLQHQRDLWIHLRDHLEWM